MATFHPFPRLPIELRISIWEMTIEPREVVVREETQWVKEDGKDFRKVVCFKSPTPAPAVLYASHEARSILTSRSLYTPAYNFGLQPRYIWVNFNIDTICVTTQDDGVLTHDRYLLRYLNILCRCSANTALYHTWDSKSLSISEYLERLLRFHELEEIVIILDNYKINEDVHDCEPVVEELVGALKYQQDKRQNLPCTRVTIRHAYDGEEFNLEDLPELYRKTEEEE